MELSFCDDYEKARRSSCRRLYCCHQTSSGNTFFFFGSGWGMLSSNCTWPITDCFHSSAEEPGFLTVSSILFQRLNMSQRLAKKCARIRLWRKSASLDQRMLPNYSITSPQQLWRSKLTFLLRFIWAGVDIIVRVSLEAGGNAPFIVFDDANIDEAIEGELS